MNIYTHLLPCIITFTLINKNILKNICRDMYTNSYMKVVNVFLSTLLPIGSGNLGSLTPTAARAKHGDDEDDDVLNRI